MFIGEMESPRPLEVLSKFLSRWQHFGKLDIAVRDIAGKRSPPVDSRLCDEGDRSQARCCRVLLASNPTGRADRVAQRVSSHYRYDLLWRSSGLIPRDENQMPGWLSRASRRAMMHLRHTTPRETC